MSGLTFVPIGGRKKEPMRGGLRPEDLVRGNTDRGFLTWLVYRSLARGDFQHDFGERTASRDLIMADDAARFFEIAKLVSTKGKVWLLTQFARYTGQTLYSLVGQHFDNNLVPLVPVAVGADDDGVYNDKNEIGLLKMLGIDYEQIKTATKASGSNPLTIPFTLPNGLGERRYIVRSSSYRLGERVNGNKTADSQTNRNIVKMFQEVTGDATKFALIVDATGGLSLSELLNNNLTPQPAARCQFYIIENIENSSDSADKVKHIKRSGPTTTDLFYLRDQTNTVTYPLWDNIGDPKSNIFAKMSIVLNRMPAGTVEAIIDAGGETFHIGDVSNASNVKNATLKALSVLIEKGVVPEVFVYTLIKRMGDWCQALSLLDMDRVYNIVSHDGPDPVKSTTTLGEMIGESVEVGVVTNDRILLAFCILHGLNVFFTSAMDLARLIYFKNANDLPSPEKLQNRLNAIINETAAKMILINAKIQTTKQTIDATISTAKDNVINSTDLPSYIRNLKNFITNVSKLTDTTFAASIAATTAASAAAQAALAAAAAQGAGAAAAAQAASTVAFTTANQYSSEVAKLKVSLDNAERISGNLAVGSYAGRTVVDVRTQALGRRLSHGGRNPKSVEVVEARDILLGIRGDVQLMISNGIVSNADITKLLSPTNPGIIGQVLAPSGAFVDERGKVNNDEVLSALVPIRLLVPPAAASGGVRIGGQRGGNLDNLYNALRTRKILLLPQGYSEVTSTPNTYVQGDDYVDDKLRAYTVVDEYIVTTEDGPTFDEFFKYDAPKLTSPVQVEYICKRYMLLQFDRLRRRYEQFKDTFYETDTGAIEDGSIVKSTKYDDDRIAMLSDLNALYYTITNLSFQSAKAYNDYDDSAVPPSLLPGDINDGLAKCKRHIFAWFLPAVLTITSDNEQKVFELSEYYANIILTTAAASLAGTPFALVRTVEGGGWALTEQGLLLQTAIRDAVANANQDEDVPINPEEVNARVATGLTSWLTPRGIPSGPLVYAIDQRLTTARREAAEAAARRAAAQQQAQAQQQWRGGRKTHRRRLPKLI